MTDTSANAWVSSTHRPMGFREFVAIVAAIMALNPLAMDLMLPACRTWPRLTASTTSIMRKLSCPYFSLASVRASS
jgi:hypothetical protein